MSYLFALPTLVGASALLLGVHAVTCWKRLAPAVLTVGIALIVLIPVIDTFFQFAQPRPGNPDSEVLFVVAIPVSLVALGIQLALVFRPGMVRTPVDDVGPGEPDIPARFGNGSARLTATSR